MKKIMIKELKLKVNHGLTFHNPFETLLNEEIIARGVWESLQDNDPNSALEIIEAHLNALVATNKEKAQRLKIEKIALKEKNPTLKKIANIINSFEKLRK